MDSRLETLGRAASAAGAQTVDALPVRIDELQTRVRDLEKRLRAGAAAGGRPRPAELAANARQVGGVPFAALAAPFASMEELKAYAKDVHGALGSGIISLMLDDELPQVWVTVSDDLVTRGLSAARLVAAAMPAINGRGGGRPQMAQGKGDIQGGIAAALAAIEAAVLADTTTPASDDSQAR
jgi:alanyl-tRNA synthetase